MKRCLKAHMQWQINKLTLGCMLCIWGGQIKLSRTADKVDDGNLYKNLLLYISKKNTKQTLIAIAEYLSRQSHYRAQCFVALGNLTEPKVSRCGWFDPEPEQQNRERRNWLWYSCIRDLLLIIYTAAHNLTAFLSIWISSFRVRRISLFEYVVHGLSKQLGAKVA